MSGGRPAVRQARPSDVAVALEGVSVRYDDTPAVREVDLEVRRGETLALLGPSGSGKTTLLYAVAGFLPLASGEIHLAGRRVAHVGGGEPPERRAVGMVFQHYGLWPHLDARDTVAYPLRRAGVGAAAARADAERLLRQLRIDHLARRRPAELSGGEQQRVGLARALARRPAVYLLDEPTAHLDPVLKGELQEELAERAHTDGAAAIHATHDVEEALALADRVALLRDGAIVQVGRPQELYERPVDAWAARLTGPCTFIEAVVEPASDGGPPVLTGAGQRCPLDPAVAGDAPAPGAGRFLVRPEQVHLDGPIPATVEDVRYRGTHTDLRLGTPLGRLLARLPGPPRLEVGAVTTCRIGRVWWVGPGADGVAASDPWV
jgi:ABC-type Fe3+/spermidine/putrescine transport system ATPase subunit